MDRRDFLKLFAITAAGIYVPKTTYFFMPQMPHTIMRPIMLSQPLAIWIGDDKYMVEPHSVLYSQTITKVNYGSRTTKLRRLAHSGMGSKEWLEKIKND